MKELSWFGEIENTELNSSPPGGEDRERERESTQEQTTQRRRLSEDDKRRTGFPGTLPLLTLLVTSLPPFPCASPRRGTTFDNEPNRLDQQGFRGDFCTLGPQRTNERSTTEKLGIWSIIIISSSSAWLPGTMNISIKRQGSSRMARVWGGRPFRESIEFRSFEFRGNRRGLIAVWPRESVGFAIGATVVAMAVVTMDFVLIECVLRDVLFAEYCQLRDLPSTKKPKLITVSYILLYSFQWNLNRQKSSSSRCLTLTGDDCLRADNVSFHRPYNEDSFTVTAMILGEFMREKELINSDVSYCN